MSDLENDWGNTRIIQKYAQIIGGRKKFAGARLRSANNQLLEVPLRKNFKI